MSVAYGKKTVDLIRLTHAIQQAYRPATEEEAQAFANWYGWGPVAPAFAYPLKPEWGEIAGSLTMLLGEDGVKMARAATPTSYYTDSFLVKAMWELAVRLGFEGGNVFEAGCGTGHFLAHAPKLSKPITFTGVEREKITADIARIRFPDANIINKPLEEVAITNGAFQLAIGNVPFANVNIFDRDMKIWQDGKEQPIKLNLHNYFIWRALKALRPGGIAILLTSRYTMDSKDTLAREYLSEYGTFLGAFRLPSGAHKAANTQVITDIVVFQRKGKDVPTIDIPWLESSYEIVKDTWINQYFEAHPNHVLGEATTGRGMHSDHEFMLKMASDLPARLAWEVEALARSLSDQGIVYIPPTDYTVIGENLIRVRGDGWKEGSFHFHENQLVQVRDGELEPVKRCKDEIMALVEIRNAALNLLEMERNLDTPDKELEPFRKELNRAYDAYVENKKYGPIHRATLTYGEPDEETGEQTITRRKPPALSDFSRDPQSSILYGLEHYDDEKKVATKADIFFRRIHQRPVIRTSAESPSEALAICLDQHGQLNLNVVADLLSLSVAEVIPQLGDMIYEVPGIGEWVTANDYLSGNIREKLEIVRRFIEDQPRFHRNLEALEKIMPEDIPADEIQAMLGALWVSPQDYEQFCADLFKIRVTVKYESTTANWDTDYTNRYPSAALTSEWGTERMNAVSILTYGLNKKVPVIYDVYDDKTVRNIDETIAAQEKLRLLQERFSEWIWQDQERTTRLAEVYNRLFNSHVNQTYSGAHMTFPGMNPDWEKRLYSWQKDAAWRAASTRSVLIGHPVGAGKTSEQVMIAMTLRRMGLTNRAAIVVPNHLIEQITSEAQRLYPSANILMISRDDLTKERKSIFAAKVASSDYDFVVMTHAALFGLGMHPETERAFLEAKLTVYRQAIINAEEEENESLKRRTVKSLEKTMERMRQRMMELLAKETQGVTFEQMGITYLCIDEAHLYKNLGLPTKMQGFQVKASRRATDLEMKLNWLEKHNQGKPFAAFFTATPLSNNMVEAYVILWYLYRDRLFEYGLTTIEAFVSTFIDMQTKFEVSVDGATFKMQTRPTRFVNMPELMNIIAEIADIRGPEILDAKRPRCIPRCIPIDPTPAITEFVDGLVKRGEKLKSEGKNSSDNWLAITGDGRRGALDLSLCGIHGTGSPKLEAVAAQMWKVYQRNQIAMEHLDGPHKSLQIGFCDQGTPSAEKGDQVYGILKRLLIEKGIPANAIRYIHEAGNDTAKAELFAKCRNGEVAILLGSTPLLGTGTNIQARAAACHHIDAPWRPDEKEQRDGRVHRPGNVYEAVEIYCYVIKRTFDAFSWQTLARKAVFFDQMRKGNLKGREMDVESETALSFGQIKAAATGDPLVLEQAELEIKIAQLQRLASMHLRARNRDRQDAINTRRYAAENTRFMETIASITDVIARCKTPGFINVKGVLIEEHQEIGKDVHQHVLNCIQLQSRGWRQIGTWSGVKISLGFEGGGADFKVYIKMGDTWGENKTMFSIPEVWLGNNQQWRIAQYIEEFFEKSFERIENLRSGIARQYEQAKELDLQAQVPFVREQELRDLIIRKKSLDLRSSMIATGGKVEEIKALTAQLLISATEIYTIDDLDFYEPEKEIVVQDTATPAPIEEMSTITVPSLEELKEIVTAEVDTLDLESLVAPSLFGDMPALKVSELQPKKKKKSQSQIATPVRLW